MEAGEALPYPVCDRLSTTRDHKQRMCLEHLGIGAPKSDDFGWDLLLLPAKHRTLGQVIMCC